jgi:hypothetical protein
MKLSDIAARASQQPFRAFSIATMGGSLIDVEKQSDIFLPALCPDLVIVFGPTERFWILDASQIAALESK